MVSWLLFPPLPAPFTFGECMDVICLSSDTATVVVWSSAQSTMVDFSGVKVSAGTDPDIGPSSSSAYFFSPILLFSSSCTVPIHSCLYRGASQVHLCDETVILAFIYDDSLFALIDHYVLLHSSFFLALITIRCRVLPCFDVVSCSLCEVG